MTHLMMQKKNNKLGSESSVSIFGARGGGDSCCCLPLNFPPPSWGSGLQRFSQNKNLPQVSFSPQPKLPLFFPSPQCSTIGAAAAAAAGAPPLGGGNAISVYSAGVDSLQPEQHGCSPGQSFPEPGSCRCRPPTGTQPCFHHSLSLPCGG